MLLTQNNSIALFILVFVLSACTGDSIPSTLQTIESPVDSTATPTIYITVLPSSLPTLTSTVQPVVNTPTPDPGENDLAWYYDGLVITLDFVGQTLRIIKGQGILFRLGEEYNWTVEVNPPDLLTLNRKITPEPGEQGVYIARSRGQAEITAIGDPICLQEIPSCSRPSVIFRMIVEVY